MSIISSTFLLLLLQLSVQHNVRAWSLWGDSGKGTIRQLSESDLDNDIPKSGLSLVMFYAPGCPYCRSFKPFFDNAVEKLAMHDPPMRFGMIDGIQYPNAILRHQIPYYPTVKLFIDSQEHQLPLTEMDVADPKCAAKVVNWVNRFIHKDHVMESVGDFEKFAENNPLLAIGLFNDERDGEFFKHCTRHFDDVFFAIAYGQVAEDIVDHLYNRR
ncbi:protein disulfide isomerase, putative [Perkinsus marinus ATCC 50983]|uniref:protein disulfide-isomerase n=1 Tax=Perkinsus marinus (strain ATCC 50983 / TXsc) TaxID=423536 RepID=C5KEX0_PERM5|nr:protein disulfide isomerase, putative [Perkinsus marinus ATCC 50983]EER16982.1 protein disulfide isomerase, putative [Perkinsus marinus ATCC 50983]|eukprot:XP_002785186.1 protein disulfide isomerase, putative [Perkinsus marinus ATCC 50983]